MSHRLLTELEIRVARWQETLRVDGVLLRYYQENLLNMRQLSRRPRASIALTLRQCVAARKMKRKSAAALDDCKRDIRELSGTAAQ
ncbi:hypothetical protein [Aeromonas rivipollensis]|uniref:hypothetical protein n=1 Tax=Aeromonas rivipollensis TaxID=948519 RepID=UPI0038D17E1E